MFNIFRKRNKKFEDYLSSMSFVYNFTGQYNILRIISKDNNALWIESNTKIKIDIGTYDDFQSNRQLSYTGTVSDIFNEESKKIITLDCSEEYNSKLVNICIGSNLIKVYDNDTYNPKIKIKLKDARILINDTYHVSLDTDIIFIEKVLSRIYKDLYIGDLVELKPICEKDDIITARIKSIKDLPYYYICNSIGVLLDASQCNKSILLAANFNIGTNQVDIYYNNGTEAHKYVVSSWYSQHKTFHNIDMNIRVSDYENIKINKKKREEQNEKI